VIRCEQLRQIYRTKHGEVRALDGIELQVAGGQFVVVRGPSGCGKTSLLHAIGGMRRPAAGRVFVDGAELYALSARRRADLRAAKIGFVFQMFHLVAYLTVLENVRLAALLRDARAVETRARELLEQLGLTSRLGHKPSELSAGEQQRTALARALLNRPEVILADEPTGNLDAENAQRVLEHLRAFSRDGGTVLMVTHSAFVEPQADRVLRMEAGRLGDQ
jgi:putative ABC transport system ATP-binding protein